MSTSLPSNIKPIAIEHELKKSYLDYAMSVIVGRALPDVRDGLKPVHRRVLYAMHELNNDYNKPYKKSARIVGDVIGKYHPHGDTAVYDAIVRMAQPFSLRYMLVDGQGNFGSVDGDSPAAMRYTEIRMAKITHELLSDIDKETVDFAPNYDNTEYCPGVLPTRVPNLLINGSAGIAVGMATNIPPHNLGEVIDATLALIDNPNTTIPELMQYLQGPDFPTGGIINGRRGIINAYETGRGKIKVRALANIEPLKNSNKEAIIVTELPYQVNKARLQEKIAELVKEKKLEGITAIRDESDKDGMRLVIECRIGENADVILNKLYKLTQLQTVFGINMVALDNNQPRCMNLKEVLEAFIRHRREVVTRRTIYLLAKARLRAHILEGLGIALTNIDEMIALIKQSKTPGEAKEAMLARSWNIGKVSDMLAGDLTLCRPQDLAEQYGPRDGQYYLSPVQAQAILDLRLHRLTGLEQDKIFAEYAEIIKKVSAFIHILESFDRLMEVIREECLIIKDSFNDPRRSEITDLDDLTDEDLIPDESVVVTVSHLGYTKVQALDTYQAQRRGGKGKSSADIKDDDFVKYLTIAASHDTLLYFTNTGRLYWLKAYQLPMASRNSRGKPIVNFLPLQEGEQITAMLPVRDFESGQCLFMATRQGTVKKVALDAFKRPRSKGIIALDLAAGDELMGVDLTEGDDDVMLFSNTGKVIRFPESAVRAMGRTARGVRGIRLKPGQEVVSLIIAKGDGHILTATEAGYGKQTQLAQYRKTMRGGQGVISIQVNERNGEVVGAVQIDSEEDAMLISNKGTLVRIHAHDISVIGRNTQGVRLINLTKGEQLIALEKVQDLHMSQDEQEETAVIDDNSAAGEDKLPPADNQVDTPLSDEDN